MVMDPVIYMQIEIAHLYMLTYGLTLDDFLELDEKYDILTFIAEGYDPFHLMGNAGILLEVKDYISQGITTC